MHREMLVKENMEEAEIIKEADIIKPSIKIIWRIRSAISVENRYTHRPTVSILKRTNTTMTRPQRLMPKSDHKKSCK